MNLNDFESAAEKMVPPRAYAYFHSAADDLRSLRNNKLDWEKVTLRPRVLRNVARVNMGCTMMGQRSRLPIFIAPAARARMAHDDGELCLARGAARRGIPYCVSCYSSVAHEDLISCVKEEKKGEGGCFSAVHPENKGRDGGIDQDG
jgi:L-lactate dehydrogenase (cytochrome)